MSNETSSKVQDAMKAAYTAIANLLDTDQKLRPQFIRIAFYDAISYNPTTKADGPNGSIRLWEGLVQEKQMKDAIGKLDDLKARGDSNVWSYVSYADLYQLAGIVAVEKAKGPKIEFQHGRMDSCIPKDSSKLPIISQDSYQKWVDTFRRIGFTHKEILALSSACHYWMNYNSTNEQQEAPIIDKSFYEKLFKLEDKDSKSKAPDNQQSTSTTTTSSFNYWKCLGSDASFRQHVELFVKEPNVIQKEYASAHKKLSELGFKYFPQHIPTEVEYKDMKHGIAFAVAMTILFGFVGFFYEVMRT